MLKPSEPHVWLVGAGPGDPELLTVRALRLIETADIIFHDALVSAAILVLANPAAEIISVGKRKDRHSMPQDAINDCLVEAANAGLRVVRLKGGDPGIFGRLQEEVDALHKNNIRFSIVPGITAATAAAASAGASLTLREKSRGVTFITAHAKKDVPLDLDWQALVASKTTLAIYMGKSMTAMLSKTLVSAGMATDTAVLVVTNASRPDEQRYNLQLNQLEQLGTRLGHEPAILIIGNSVEVGMRNQFTHHCDIIETDNWTQNRSYLNISGMTDVV